MKKMTWLCFNMAIISCFLIVQRPSTQESGASFQRPESGTIEMRLFESVNVEREKRELPHLRLSSVLTDLARSHSQRMAEIQTLTHLSPSGGTYRDRLIQRGEYFIKVGESLAFSETFRSELIHQKMMESSELRENLIEPDFDEVGLGVSYRENKGYYITLDFRQSLKILDSHDVELAIRDRIDKIRKDMLQSSLSFSENACNAARDFSKKKARGELLPHVADEFGETLIHISITPQPDRINDLEEKVTGLIYEEAGVGVWFGKNEAYPGGAYFITLFLLPKSQYERTLDDDVARMIFEDINSRRREMKHLPLRWDKRLSREAKKMSELVISQGQQQTGVTTHIRRRTFYNYFLQNQTLTYISDNPRIWPESVTEKVMDASAKKVGIGASFTIDPKSRREMFWISIIVRD